MILVTGAGGFIGRNVVRVLAARGRQVRAMIHRGNKSGGGAASGAAGAGASGTAELFAGLELAETAEGDVRDVESLAAAMRGCAQVIHLVGIIVPGHGASFEKVHLKGTANVIEAARQNKIERIIYMSGLGAGAKARSRYGRSKWQAEETLRASGLDLAIVRPSMVFGPGDHFVEKFAAIARWAPAIVMPGGGRTRLQPVWVEDLAVIVAALAERDKLGGAVIPVGGSQVVTLKEAVRAITRAAGRPRPLVSLPFWMMKPAAYLCEKTSRRPLITRDQLAMLQSGAFTCDITPLIEQFGIDLLSFDKGLERMFEKSV